MPGWGCPGPNADCKESGKNLLSAARTHLRIRTQLRNTQLGIRVLEGSRVRNKTHCRGGGGGLMRNQQNSAELVCVQVPKIDTCTLFPTGPLTLGLIWEVVDACFRERKLFKVGGTYWPRLWQRRKNYSITPRLHYDPAKHLHILGLNLFRCQNLPQTSCLRHISKTNLEVIITISLHQRENSSPG